MPAITYGKNCYFASPTVESTSGDRVWEFVKFVVAALKGMSTAPWVTRGSSCDGSSGTAFSATPDGVDRWAGKTIGQAATNAGIKAIWHVLENSVTGLQVTIHFASAAANGAVLVFSMNKFENAGAWRGGGTSAVIRPTDTASSPAAGREISSIFNAFATSPAGTGVPQIFRFNCVNRDDGKGFYAYYFPDSGATAVTASSSFGVFPVTNPQTETNPYLVLAAQNQALNTTSGVAVGGDPGSLGTPSLIGRKGAAGTLVNYCLLRPSIVPGSPIIGTTHANDLDPVLTAYPLFPNIAWANTPTNEAHFRCGIPDLYQSSQPAFPDFNTWNGKSYIQIGCAVFPYDPAQPIPRGIDRTGYLFSIDGDLQEDVTYTPDHRPFNSGLEKI